MSSEKVRGDKYFLGLDNGGTATKAALYDLRGRETGALGCAIAASVAVGAYPSLPEACAAMCPAGERVMPDMKAHAAYQKRFQLYQRINESLDGIWEDVRDCVEKG